MWRMSAANCGGWPSSFGNGTEAARLCCAASGNACSIGVVKIPGAMALTRMPNLANSRAAGATDYNARRAVIGGGLGERFFRRGAVGHVAMDGDAVDGGRDFGGPFVIDVEDGDFGAGFCEHARGRCTKAGGAAGYDCGMA